MYNGLWIILLIILLLQFIYIVISGKHKKTFKVVLLSIIDILVIIFSVIYLARLFM